MNHGDAQRIYGVSYLWSLCSVGTKPLSNVRQLAGGRAAGGRGQTDRQTCGAKRLNPVKGSQHLTWRAGT